MILKNSLFTNIFFLLLLLPLSYEEIHFAQETYVQPKPEQQQKKHKPLDRKRSFKKFQTEPQEDSSIIDFYIKSSFELYHFAVLDDENNEKSTHDYTGRINKMDYSFSPVYLASFNLYAAWSIFQFEGIYKTNRIIKGGGTIEKGDDAVSTITNDSQISEALGFGIQVFNLHTSFRTVHFNFGKADVVNAINDNTVQSQDLLLKVNEADIRYNSSYRLAAFGPTSVVRYRFFLGYRYMQYSLPRIVYTFRKAEDTDQTDKKYIYKDETNPQEIPIKLHMAGYGFETSVQERGSNLEIMSDLAFFYGAGNTKFKTRNSGELKERFLSSIQFQVKPGLSYKLSKGMFKTSFKVQYEFNLLVPNPVNFSKNSNLYTFGQADLYHGLFVGFDLLF